MSCRDRFRSPFDALNVVPRELECPDCDALLARDPAPGARVWSCVTGHRYAGTRSLLVAMFQRGRMPRVAFEPHTDA